YFKPSGSSTVAAQVALPATDITQILPASVATTSTDFKTCTMGTAPTYSSSETVTIPTLAAGNYDLYFAFIEPTYQQPIQLAHSQKDSAGRYLLGQISIQVGGQVTPTS